jgi:hypothetical protein
MAKLRFYDISAVTPVSYKLRWHDVSATGGLTGSKLRVLKIQATGVVPTPKLRAFKLQATGATGGANPRLRLYEVSGGAATGLRLRWYDVSLNSVTVPAIAAFPEITAEPLTTTSVTAVLAAGSVTPDAWSWRQISVSSDISLTNANSQTVQFISPSPMPSENRYVTLGVTAFSGGLPSTEVTANIMVFPQLDWTWDGLRWVGSKVNEL